MYQQMLMGWKQRARLNQTWCAVGFWSLALSAVFFHDPGVCPGCGAACGRDRRKERVGCSWSRTHAGLEACGTGRCAPMTGSMDRPLSMGEERRARLNQKSCAVGFGSPAASAVFRSSALGPARVVGRPAAETGGRREWRGDFVYEESMECSCSRTHAGLEVCATGRCVRMTGSMDRLLSMGEEQRARLNQTLSRGVFWESGASTVFPCGGRTRGVVRMGSRAGRRGVGQ
jgi:hypothetical protein